MVLFVKRSGVKKPKVSILDLGQLKASSCSEFSQALEPVSDGSELGSNSIMCRALVNKISERLFAPRSLQDPAVGAVLALGAPKATQTPENHNSTRR